MNNEDQSEQVALTLCNKRSKSYAGCYSGAKAMAEIKDKENKANEMDFGLLKIAFDGKKEQLISCEIALESRDKQLDKKQQLILRLNTDNDTKDKIIAAQGEEVLHVQQVLNDKLVAKDKDIERLRGALSLAVSYVSVDLGKDNSLTKRLNKALEGGE